MKFTDDQLKNFLVSFFEQNDQLPTQLMIAKKFNVFVNAANERLLKFEREGYLCRNAANKYMFARTSKNKSK